MSEVQVFDYYYGDESRQFSFYRIPRLLIRDKRFSKLSTDAKLLYGLMLDRMGLSARNGWYDSEGRVYIYYPLEEVQQDMNCGHDKATKLLVELDGGKGFGLIERVRQGQGRPTKIYVKRFTTREIPPQPSPPQGTPPPSGPECGKAAAKSAENRSLGCGISAVKSAEKPPQVILNLIKLILSTLIHLSIHPPPHRRADG